MIVVTKVIELVGSSNYNWTDAVNNAVHEASKTVDDIMGVEVSNFTANITDGNVTEYKANVQIAFHVHS
jgi:flavin-binding protein dodecin